MLRKFIGKLKYEEWITLEQSKYFSSIISKYSMN